MYYFTRIFFTYLSFFSFYLYSNDHAPIVFIHIGNKIPAHAKYPIIQAQKFNPESEIYFLTSADALKDTSRDFKRIFSQSHVHHIDIDSLDKAPIHVEFDKVNRFNNFRNGFWSHTTERFFYLYEFIKEKNLENVIHLENDVMLYLNMDEILPIFKKISTRIGIPMLAKNNAIPGFVYIKDDEALSNLLDDIVISLKKFAPRKRVSSCKMSEMFTIAYYHQKYGESGLTPLPILMPEYALHNKRRVIPLHRFNHKDTTLDFLTQHWNDFDGYIFDAAALGIYFDGHDPRGNAEQGPGAIHWKSLFDPSIFEYEWLINEDGLRYPILKYLDKTYRIINLHIHSKGTHKFVS
ncbi:MAG: hypothetical protein WDZ28_01230 [Simkaniaceae bacterium]